MLFDQPSSKKEEADSEVVSLPAEFDELAPTLKGDKNKQSSLNAFFILLIDGMDPHENWESLDETKKNNIVKLMKLFLDANHIKYIAEAGIITISLVLLAQQNKKIFSLLEKISSKNRLVLISEIKKYCDRHNYPFKKMPERLQVKIIESLYFLIECHNLSEIDFMLTDDSYIMYAKEFSKVVADEKTTSQQQPSSANSIKLHVTLQWQDYYTHKNKLVALLVDYAKKGVIRAFKFIYPPAFDLKENPAAFLKNLNMNSASSRSIARIVNGDQIAIYLPPENDPLYDKEKIAEMCENLNNYCMRFKLVAGATTAIESPLTSYVILRQDTVGGEYISAMTSDEATIKRVRELQESSELYGYLNQKLNPRMENAVGRGFN